jgi:hypothetical protein
MKKSVLRTEREKFIPFYLLTDVTLDGNGEPQTLPPGSEITESLFVRGDSPNYVPWGSQIIIRAQLDDQSVLFTNHITVASTRVVEKTGSETQSIDDRLVPGYVGIQKHAKPGVLYPLYLFSDVLINCDLILSLGGPPGAFRIFAANSTNAPPLLVSGQTITNGVNGANFATPGQTSEIWIEFRTNGVGNVSYGFVGTNNAAGISFSDTLNITAYDVNLGFSKTNLTLLETNVLSVAVIPSSLSVSNYVFEISRTNTPLSWYQWHQGDDNIFTNIARTAGSFKVRASAYVEGEKAYSNVEDIEVQFPSLDDFIENADLKFKLYPMWQSTLDFTTGKTTHIREEGCYITLDTATGEYGVTPIPSIKGQEKFAYENGSITNWPKSRPPDLFYDSSPTGTAVYVVGWFHTHPPMTYAPPDHYREVGPSIPDRFFSLEPSTQVPGIVYDYVSVAFGNFLASDGKIPGGHPMNASTKLYPITPPLRRATP